MKNNFLKQYAGFTLMEVLIALAVLSIGLLGMAGMQLYSMKSSHNAYLQSQASYFAYDLIDKMRANPVGFNNGNYDTTMSAGPVTAPPDCQSTTSTCSPDQLAIFELAQWKCSLGSYENDSNCGALSMTSILPNGDGEVARNGDDVTVTIQWGAGANQESIMVMAEL